VHVIVLALLTQMVYHEDKFGVSIVMLRMIFFLEQGETTQPHSQRTGLHKQQNQVCAKTQPPYTPACIRPRR
jgi:hypothetical protein